MFVIIFNDKPVSHIAWNTHCTQLIPECFPSYFRVYPTESEAITTAARLGGKAVTLQEYLHSLTVKPLSCDELLEIMGATLRKLKFAISSEEFNEFCREHGFDPDTI